MFVFGVSTFAWSCLLNTSGNFTVLKSLSTARNLNIFELLLFNPAKIAKDDRSAHSSGSVNDIADVSLPTLEHGLVNFNQVFDGIKTGTLTATVETRPINGFWGLWDDGDQQIAANICDVHCALPTLDNSRQSHEISILLNFIISLRQSQ